MTLGVGLLLVAVFLAFATLMFLERLSALLALPLMAFAFLVVALAADLAQPAVTTELVTLQSTDDFGRRQTTTTQVEQPSRFTEWQAILIEHERILSDKAAFAGAAAEALLAAARQGPDALRAELRTQRDALRAFNARVMDPLARYPDYDRNAQFRNRLSALAVDEQMQALADVVDQPDETPLIERAAPIVARLQSLAAAERSDVDAINWLYAAWLYVSEYLIALFGAGSLRLSSTIIATIFGGMFAMYVKNLKIAERVVYWTAEFAGERPLVVTLAVFLATAGIFTSVGGLGTVIMLGAIILPVLRSIGLGPVVAAGVFLIAIAMGGTLQPINRRLWMDVFGVTASEIDGLVLTMVSVYAAVGFAWIVWGTRRTLLSSFMSEPAPVVAKPRDDVPAYLMAAPLLPVLLVYFGRVDEIAAFTAGLAYMFVCVARRAGAVRQLSRSMIEGAQTVMPPVLLMVGIGLLLQSLGTAPVQTYLKPLLATVVPQTQFGYIALFALGAPLALYRGPLNIWGMGLAVSAILLATSGLPPAAILGAILAAGMLQGVSDPTNTANVWIAGFMGVTVNQILRYTLLPVWIGAAIAVVIFALRYVEA